MTLTAKLEYVDLARRCAKLERRVDRAFDALLRTKAGDPTWRRRNDEIFALEQELASVRARIAVISAANQGERHLKAVP